MNIGGAAFVFPAYSGLRRNDGTDTQANFFEKTQGPLFLPSVTQEIG